MNKIILILLLVLIILITIVSICFANPLPAHWVYIDMTTPARTHFQATYHSQWMSIILFGGQDTSGQLPNDLWQYDGGHWSMLNFTGPCGRIDFGMCDDPQSNYNNIVLFGGKDSMGNYLGDTWILSDSGWTQLDIQGPSPRAGFAMDWAWPSGGGPYIILFGGADSNTFFGDTWGWAGTHWIPQATGGPSPRIYSAISNGVLFGGLDDSSRVLNDTWEWGTFGWYCSNPNPSPDPRIGHMMGFQGLWGFYLFGGQDALIPQNYFGDFWFYWETEWDEESHTQPPARSFGVMVSSGANSYIIGGTNGNRIFHDMWQFPIYYPQYRIGDINNDYHVNGLDIAYFINYMRGGMPPPVDMGTPIGQCPEPSPFYAAVDVNGSCSANGVDITFFVRFLRGQVPSLFHCPDCYPWY